MGDAGCCIRCASRQARRRFVVVTRDVTEQLNQVSELARQRQELERSNRDESHQRFGRHAAALRHFREAYRGSHNRGRPVPRFSGSISILLPSRDLLDSRRDGATLPAAEFGPSLIAGRFARASLRLGRGRPRLRPPQRIDRAAMTCVPMIGQSDAWACSMS